MKKLLVFALICALSIVLAGCQQGDGKKTPPKETGKEGEKSRTTTT